MDLFSESKINFMKYRKVWVWVSVTLLAGSVLSTFFGGSLNLGIDFAGGTQLTVKFREQPDVEELRRLIAQAGIPDAPIQRFGGAPSKTCPGMFIRARYTASRAVMNRVRR